MFKDLKSHFNHRLRQTLVQRLSVLSFWNQRTQESPAQNQDDHASDSESQQVLSILELIPLKHSPKHNGKVISYIETTNILSDEEKPQKDQTGERSKELQKFNIYKMHSNFNLKF